MTDVSERSFHVIGVLPESSGEPEYAYTIGLYHRYGHPEMAVFGLPYETSSRLLASVCELVSEGSRFTPGAISNDILNNYPVVFLEFQHSKYEQYLGKALQFYRDDNFPTLTMCWPDKDGNFPWEENAPKWMSDRQPEVWEPAQGFLGSNLEKSEGRRACNSERICLIFKITSDDTGWPPVDHEKVWARLTARPGVVEIDSTPWWVRDVAKGDTFEVHTGESGERYAIRKVSASGNCTIRIIPLLDGPLAGSKKAVLAAFAAVGVEGAGLEAFNILAFNVPSDADLKSVKRLLDEGVNNGLWDYEEGCVSSAWHEP
ncbi:MULTISPECIES: DUF4262 domain-containing protein [unclassified Nocardia]|uniref:DUF4262 domain-containing protein n=1 Tax=unclassified Nocardia TaxID=2637762 RepID=UPI00278C372B|nr:MULTISPECIES: DUF4262 domain-containing protein [unclassified Nocardia]